jgi:hypothetical protein
LRTALYLLELGATYIAQFEHGTEV